MHSLLTFLLTILSLSAPQNEKTDSLVRLLSAQSAQLLEDEGKTIRKVIGPARFLHNDTYLLCDTAYWDVDNKIIKAFSNVQILQDETVLTSDKLDYLIDENLAEFRGSVVQLQDKDGNTLRTRYLDYNTKDSVAVFSRGGSMRDKDGQIIESLKGTYDSKIKIFTFNTEVNMFSDSVFISTSFIEYQANSGKALFDDGVNAWKEDKMLSSNNGYYDSSDSTFFFTDDVHAMSEDQEGWADSLYFYRQSKNILLLGNAQIVDTTRKSSAMGDYIFYEDSISTITIEKNAAIIAELEQNGQLDTTYLGADRIRYWTRKRCDIPEQLIADAGKRLTDLAGDPVTAYRKKAAEELAAAAKAKAAEEEKNNPNRPPVKAEAPSNEKNESMEVAPPADSLTVAAADTLAPPADSLTVAPADTLAPPADALAVAPADTLAPPADSLTVAPADTLAPPADSLTVAVDTTKVGFALALGDVRMYKNDMQMRCDSLVYSDLDSLIRMFVDPVIWNEGVRQYSADSLSIIVKDKRMDKASLMSNAFIVIQEDSLLYDQIRSVEMMAYFDSTGALTRFDALGGATAVFYLEEQEALATVNKVESKMLSATFKDGEIQKVYYFDSPKNDAYPTVQLPPEDKRMKGFKWNPDIRPNGREDITSLVPKTSERNRYEAYPQPEYNQTSIYFPGYMADIYRQIEVRDSLRVERERAREEMKRMKEAQKASLDTLLALNDSLVVKSLADSLQRDSLLTRPDSLSVASDSLSKAENDNLTAAELRRLEKQKLRDAKWAALDERDAAKTAAKEQKKLERQRRRALRLIKAAEKEAARDQKKLDRYILRYQKRKDRMMESGGTPPPPPPITAPEQTEKQYSE